LGDLLRLAAKPYDFERIAGKHDYLAVAPLLEPAVGFLKSSVRNVNSAAGIGTYLEDQQERMSF
jgi:hypothetical protein